MKRKQTRFLLMWCNDPTVGWASTRAEAEALMRNARKQMEYGNYWLARVTITPVPEKKGKR